MTRKHPLHRIGLAVLVADLCCRARVERDPDAYSILIYRLRVLHPSVTLTDDQLEAYFDTVNRRLPSPLFRIAHAQCLEILEHAVESYSCPELGDDDVAA